VNVEDGAVILGIHDIAHYGPGALQRVREDHWGRTSWLTKALAYCYEDWCAQQRMDDDGMRNSRLTT
jgi:hypothetical protein